MPLNLSTEDGSPVDSVVITRDPVGSNYDSNDPVTSEDTGLYDAEMVDKIERLSTIVTFPDIFYSPIDKDIVRTWAFGMEEYYPVQRIMDPFLLPQGLKSQVVLDTLNDRETDPTTKVARFLDLANKYRRDGGQGKRIDQFIADALKKELAPQDKRDLLTLYAQLRRRNGYQNIENISPRGGAMYNADEIYNYREEYLKPWDAICKEIGK